MANEKRLVNAEAIARKLKNAHCAECNVVRKIQCSACWVEDVLELLEGDAVDAVEVVRCKYCKHRGDDVHCPMCFEEAIEWDDDGYTEVDYVIHDHTTDDGFCDRGERREGE